MEFLIPQSNLEFLTPDNDHKIHLKEISNSAKNDHKKILVQMNFQSLNQIWNLQFLT